MEHKAYMPINSVQFFLLFLFGYYVGMAQVSPDCANAVPICNNTPINNGTNGIGIDDFNGATQTGCMTLGVGPIEKNSAWYRFKTGESGQLGINIGFDVSEDWDFALYKTDDCGQLGEPVRCNYFDNSDNNTYTGIGEDPTGADNFQYDHWLTVSPGEEYYLFVNNFSASNSGFSVQFTGQIFIDYPNTALDCSIVTNLLGPPISVCDNDSVTLNATTMGAVQYEWYLDVGNGYELLPSHTNPDINPDVSGMYRVLVVMPDGNNIISAVQVAFAPSPITYPLIDENLCVDQGMMDLSTKDAEALGNQSAADFRVAYYSSQADAINAVNALPKNIEPVQGSQTIFVRTTAIKNPDCFDTSQSFQIHGVTPPILDVETLVYVCQDSPVAIIGQSMGDPSSHYLWDTGQTTSQISVSQPGEYTLTATSNNGAVSCSTSQTIQVIFSITPEITAVDVTYINDSNTITISLRELADFDFQIDGGQPQSSGTFVNVLPGSHTLTVSDRNGCGTATEQVEVVGFPKFFTPNGDGANDFWKVEGMSVLENPKVHIYDRFGKLIKELNQNSMGWDGTLDGVPLPETDYWFKLSYIDSNGQESTAKIVNSHFSLKR